MLPPRRKTSRHETKRRNSTRRRPRIEALEDRTLLATLHPGDIIVADINAAGGSGAILRVDPLTGAQEVISSGGYFVNPNGVAIDASGDILVADYDAFGGTGGIIRVNPATGNQTPVSTHGYFDKPYMIAIDSNGALLVADNSAFLTPGSVQHGAIIRVDPVTGTQELVSSGGLFASPDSLTIDGSGQIIVADENSPPGMGEETGSILRVDPVTGTQATVSTGGYFRGPCGVVVAPDGDYLVVDFGSFGSPTVPGQGGVFRVDPLTGAQTIISSGGLFNDPFNLAVASNGDILVVDLAAFGGPGGVIRVNPITGAQTAVSSGGLFVEPSGIAIVPGPSNHAPTAVDDAASTVEDTPVDIAVLDNDIDADGDTLTAIQVTAPFHGDVVLNSDGSFTYTPRANYFGSDSFTCRVWDGSAYSAPATVEITITDDGDGVPRGLAPGTILVADNHAFDGAIIAIDPDTGAQSLIATGGYIVHPNALTVDVNGDIVLPVFDSFTPQTGAIVRVDPILGRQALVSVGGLLGQPTGGAPTGIAIDSDGTILVSENHGLFGLTAIVRVDPATGAQSYVSTKGYMVNPDRIAIDAAGRIVVADENSFDLAGAVIRIDPATGAQEVVSRDGYFTGPCSIAVDADGTYWVTDFAGLGPGAVFHVDPATQTKVLVSQGGSFINPLDIAIASDGALIVADSGANIGPGAVFHVDRSTGAQTVISAGGMFVDPTGIAIVPAPANSPPTAVDDTASVFEDTATTATGNVLANDSDADQGNTLSVANPGTYVGTYGTLILDADGAYTYTLNNAAVQFLAQGDTRSDPFSYQASDGLAISSPAMLTVFITGTNDAPTAFNDTAGVVEDTAFTATGNVLVNDTDVDEGTTLSVANPGTYGGAYGTLILNADGSYTYTLNNAAVQFLAQAETRSDSFSYHASDGLTTSNTATLSVTITGTNDAPVAVNDSYTTDEGTPLSIDSPGILGNDTDAEGDALTTCQVTAPLHGELVLDPDGSFTYTPDPAFSGSDSFTYKARDPRGAESNTVEVIIAVKPIPPTVISAVYEAATNTVVITFSEPMTPLSATNPANYLIEAASHEGELPVTEVVLTNGGTRAVLTLGGTPVADVTYRIVVRADRLTDLAGNPISDTVDLVVAEGDGLVLYHGHGDGRFSSPERIGGLASGHNGITTGDFNEDGWLDLVAAHRFTNTVTLLLGNGDGTFGPPSSLIVNAAEPNEVAAADLDLDGHLDLITANRDNSVAVLVGHGDGTFALGGALGVPFSPATITTGDFNNDGKPDVAVGTEFAGTVPDVSVLIGNGDATFAPAQSFNLGSGFGPYAVTIADLDGDGNADLVSADFDSNTVFIKPGNGDGTFGPQTTVSVGTNPREVKAADLNGDGRLDLVTVNEGSNNVSVLLGSGGFAFSMAVNYPAGAGSNSVQVADYNGDGKLDLAVMNHFDRYISVLLGTGDGGFLASLNTQEHRLRLFEKLASANIDPLQEVGDFVGPNHSPTAQAGGPYVVDEGREITLDGSGSSDPDQPSASLTYEWDLDYDGTTFDVDRTGMQPTVSFPDDVPTRTIALRVTDQGGLNSLATTTLEVTNLAPEAVGDSAATDEDTSATVDVLVNDSDVPGDPLTLSTVSSSSAHGGSVVNNGDGTVTYTPPANFSGTDTFEYTVGDGDGGTATGTVSIMVSAVNDAPVAVDDTAVTAEDTYVDIPVLSNDADVDNTNGYLRIEALSEIVGGSAVILADCRTVRFTPAPNANDDNTPGGFSFKYRTTDQSATSANDATVTISVTPVNDAPTALNDTASVVEDTTTTATGNVLANDGDVDEGTTLMVANPGGYMGIYGALTLNADGSYTYSLNNAAIQFLAQSQTVSETFSYQASDGLATSAATLTVTITGTNDAPVAMNDTASVVEDTMTTATGNVLNNDTDVDQGSTLSVANPGTYVGTYGTLTLNANGSYIYTLNNVAVQFLGQGQTVIENFSYQASDGLTTSNSATLTVTITGTNDAPVAVGDTASVVEDTTLTATGNVLANDSDVDQGTTLSVANPGTYVGTYGTLTLNANGSYTYTLNNAAVQFLAQGDTRSDSFSYQASDGLTTSNSATLLITISGTNDPPVASVGFNTLTPNKHDILIATATKTDADGNPVHLTFVWKINGAVVRTLSSATALVDSLDLKAAKAKAGDVVTVEVTPNDGLVNGMTVSATATVA